MEWAGSAVATGCEERAATRIWMVDDNANFRALLRNLLEEVTEFEIERDFSSPAKVLDALARETAPDIILLDIEMGEDNGLDAIRPIKLLAPETHVLMLTTFAGPGARQKAFREGASDFLLKRWDPLQIAAHIRRAKDFGPVAGLMTTFLTVERAVVKLPEPEPVAMEKASRAEEGWWAYLRGLLKFGVP